MLSSPPEVLRKKPRKKWEKRWKVVPSKQKYKKLGSLALNQLIKRRIRSSNKKVMLFSKWQWSIKLWRETVERSIVLCGTTACSTRASSSKPSTQAKMPPIGLEHATSSMDAMPPTNLNSCLLTPRLSAHLIKNFPGHF